MARTKTMKSRKVQAQSNPARMFLMANLKRIPIHCQTKLYKTLRVGSLSCIRDVSGVPYTNSPSLFVFDVAFTNMDKLWRARH